MSETLEYIKQLAASGRVDLGRIQKLAEGAGARFEAINPNLKKKIQSIGGYIGKGLDNPKTRGTVALTAVGAGAALGLAAISKAHDEIKFRAALMDLKKDPEIQSDPERAASIAKLVRRWAPSVAADAQVLKGTVKSLMKFPDSYLTHDVAKKLSETDQAYASTHGLWNVIERKLF